MYDLEDVPCNVTPPESIIEIQERHRILIQKSKITVKISKSRGDNLLKKPQDPVIDGTRMKKLVSTLMKGAGMKGGSSQQQHP